MPNCCALRQSLKSSGIETAACFVRLAIRAPPMEMCQVKSEAAVALPTTEWIAIHQSSVHGKM